MRRRAFTLIELLAVIATIAILASLFLPALATARFQAKNTICKNNLRQIDLALQMYATSYEIYPPVYQHIGGNGETSTQLMWDQYLEPFLFPKREIKPYLYASGIGSTRTVEKFFLCPFFPSKLVNRQFDLSMTRVPPLYGYNSTGVGDSQSALGLGAPHSLYRLMYPDMAGVPEWTREGAVIVPSDMIAIGDPFTREVLPEQDSLIQDTGSWKPHSVRSAPNANLLAKSRAAVKIHRSQMNRAFCDVHVEAEDFKKPFVATDDYLRRWNRDNKPHRDIWDTSY
jgi:prepilin-type N-terminal cleavage/methylation domain-containing protein